MIAVTLFDKFVYLTQIRYKKQTINEIYKYSIFRDCILDKLAIYLRAIWKDKNKFKKYLSKQQTSFSIKNKITPYKSLL